jgi:hypothetical protein
MRMVPDSPFSDGSMLDGRYAHFFANLSRPPFSSSSGDITI